MTEVVGSHGVSKMAPCVEACPAGIDVPRYVKHIKEGKFDRALAVIREKIPFPAVCGYVCVHPCEARCSRCQLDEPVAIRALKVTVVREGGDGWKRAIKKRAATGKKVAVVGAGPSGLSAAYYLSRLGHSVTVFEALPEPGGIMRYGIPEYRFPRELLSKEIEDIKEIGVEIKTNTRVEAVDKLLQQGFQAIYIACGLWQGARLGIEGEDLPGVVDGFSFLTLMGANGSRVLRVGDKIVVIGAGNTAIDVARTCIRLGAKEVTIIYRRTRAEMPASNEEVEDALEEGVKFEFLAFPIRIGQDRAGYRVSCQRTKLGEKDASGRAKPVLIEGAEFLLKCNSVIVAVGQVPAIPPEFGLEVNEKGSLQVNLETLETNRPGVFAGGDVVTGAGSIIEAIASGRLAASSIDRYLGGDGMIDEALVPDEEAVVPPVDDVLRRGLSRQHPPTIPMELRLTTFHCVETGYDVSSAVKEAERCLRCDIRAYTVEVDGDACKGCGYCAAACRLGVFSRADYFSRRGHRPMLSASAKRCIGCLECFFVCPDFAINIKGSEREV